MSFEIEKPRSIESKINDALHERFKDVMPLEIRVWGTKSAKQLLSAFLLLPVFALIIWTASSMGCYAEDALPLMVLGGIAGIFSAILGVVCLIIGMMGIHEVFDSYSITFDSRFNLSDPRFEGWIPSLPKLLKKLHKAEKAKLDKIADRDKTALGVLGLLEKEVSFKQAEREVEKKMAPMAEQMSSQ